MNVVLNLQGARCVQFVGLVYHGVFPRPENSPQDCFLNGLSNPLNKKNKEHTVRIFLVLVEEGGFEPPKSLTADLQSAPFGRSGTLPY